MLQGILIIVFMLIMMGFMISRKMPTVIALLILSVGVCIIAGVPMFAKDAEGTAIGFFDTVIVAGTTGLASNIMIAIFAAWLGCIMDVTNITRTLIKKGSELGGDKTLVVTLILFIICSLLHTVLTGLGGMIMICTIVVPILISVGVDKLTASIIMLMAKGVGNTISMSSPATYATITSTDFETVYNYSLILAAIAFVASIVFIVWRYKRVGKKFAFAAPVSTDTADDSVYQIKGVTGALAMLTPIIPVVLVAVCKLAVIPALLIATLWAVLLTCWKTGWGATMNMLTKTLYDGFNSCGPAATLMISIGILLKAIKHEAVAGALEPFVSKIVPSTPIAFILFFCLLAPLCLYRGPLNLWGMGAGIAALMVGLNVVPANVIMAGFVGVTVMQCICCPTNTQNVWVAGFVGEDVSTILNVSMRFIWPATVVMILIGAFMFF